MKIIEEIRIENMAILRDEAGSVTALSARLGRSDSQVSQWLNASINSGTGKPRGMKPKTARWIEETVGKPHGWLDQDHSSDGLNIQDQQITNQIKDEFLARDIPDHIKQTILTLLASSPEKKK